MPRAAQLLEQRQSRTLDPFKMPDSSAGSSPRAQPAKPVRIGGFPRALSAVRSLAFQREIERTTQMHHERDMEIYGDDENQQGQEPNPSTPFIKPAIGSSPSPKTPKSKSPSFSPRPGSLCEAAMEVSKSVSPLQRSNKWLKEPSQDTDTKLPPNKFYKSRGLLSDRDLNAKVNKTGSSFSTPKHKAEHQFPPTVTIDDAETDSDIKKTDSASPGVEAAASQLVPHKIGLQNRGNTCYLNSTLQALLGLPMLVTDATNLKHAVQKMRVNMEATKLVEPFTTLCLAQSLGDVSKTNSKAAEVKTDMELLDGQFAGHKMQDANEFLCRFMDELRENIGKVFSEVSGDSKEVEVEDDSGTFHSLTNLVDTNFQYEKQEQFVCCNCGHKSETKYTDVNFFLDLSGGDEQEDVESNTLCEKCAGVWCLKGGGGDDASLSSSVSIQQLVEQTLAPEVREKRCEQCGHETATTTTQLVTVPRVMLLYLKRYKYLGTAGGGDGAGTTTSRKVTRLVDIPDTVSLHKLVSDTVRVPEAVLPDTLAIADTEAGVAEARTEAAADTTQDTQLLLPTTPVKSSALPLTYEGQGTPIKFKGKTEEDLAKLSEEEQTEYLLYISQKEAMTSTGREVVLVNEDEDEDLKAALEASLLDVGNDTITSATNGYESDTEKENRRHGPGHEFKTPPRKRHHSATSTDAVDTPPLKAGRHTGGVFSHSTETLTRRGPTPTPTSATPTLPHSPAAEKSSPDKKLSWKKSFHRPETKAEEEADMLRALELSTQETIAEDMVDDAAMVQETSDANDNLEESAEAELVTGPPEHCYKLSSVVSHFGASTTAGHYVADVHRFDAGGWYRYDDTVVTETNEVSVRKGSNRANGYIFMYVHTPLWDQCNMKHNKNINNNNNVDNDPLLCDSSV